MNETVLISSRNEGKLDRVVTDLSAISSGTGPSLRTEKTCISSSPTNTSPKSCFVPSMISSGARVCALVVEVEIKKTANATKNSDNAVFCARAIACMCV